MDSESNALRIIWICIILTAISSLFICLRMYTRLFVVKLAGWDDWFMFAAGLFSIGTSITTSFRTTYGLGHHVWTIPESSVEPGLKAFYLAVGLYNTSQILVKLSIIFQYIRIFETPTMEKACRIALAIIVLYGTLTVGTSFIPCIPVSAFWDATVKGKCINGLPYWYTTSCLNIVTDVGIFVLPLPVLAKLQMPIRQKIGLIGILTIGFLVCIISIARIHTLSLAGVTKDPTWDFEAAATWSIVELNLGIVCGCLPVLKPLFAKFTTTFASTANKSNRYTTEGASTKQSQTAQPAFQKGEFQVIDEGDGKSTDELWVPLDSISEGQNKVTGPAAC